jgi:hypothetical protein
VTNIILGVYLCCLTGDQPQSWLHWLPFAEYCCNTSFQTTIRTTPFKVVYGRDPPTLLSHVKGSSRVPAVEQQLLEHNEFLLDLKERLLHAQVMMKSN